jgi:hypothetical protein
MHVQGAKDNELDAVLGHMGMSSDDLGSLHRAMGASLVQKQKKDLAAVGLTDETATAYRAFMKRLTECRHCVAASSIRFRLRGA